MKNYLLIAATFLSLSTAAVANPVAVRQNNSATGIVPNSIVSKVLCNRDANKSVLFTKQFSHTNVSVPSAVNNRMKKAAKTSNVNRAIQRTSAKDYEGVYALDSENSDPELPYTMCMSDIYAYETKYEDTGEPVFLFEGLINGAVYLPCQYDAVNDEFVMKNQVTCGKDERYGELYFASLYDDHQGSWRYAEDEELRFKYDAESNSLVLQENSQGQYLWAVGIKGDNTQVYYIGNGLNMFQANGQAGGNVWTVGPDGNFVGPQLVIKNVYIEDLEDVAFIHGFDGEYFLEVGLDKDNRKATVRNKQTMFVAAEMGKKIDFAIHAVVWDEEYQPYGYYVTSDPDYEMDCMLHPKMITMAADTLRDEDGKPIYSEETGDVKIDWQYFYVSDDFDEYFQAYVSAYYAGVEFWYYDDNDLYFYRDPAGIKDINAANDKKKTGIFNLAGQRVAANTRGILVKNGRKMINKL